MGQVHRDVHSASAYYGGTLIVLWVEEEGNAVGSLAKGQRLLIPTFYFRSSGERYLRYDPVTTERVYANAR